MVGGILVILPFICFYSRKGPTDNQGRRTPYPYDLRPYQLALKHKSYGCRTPQPHDVRLCYMQMQQLHSEYSAFHASLTQGVVAGLVMFLLFL